MDAGELGQLRVFADLPEEDLVVLSSGFTEVSLPAGEVLARDGEFGDRFFGILEGVAGVTRDGRHVAVLEAGDSFGELSLVTDDGRRTATVVATSDIRLASLMSWDFRELEARFPTVWSKIQAAMTERWR